MICPREEGLAPFLQEIHKFSTKTLWNMEERPIQELKAASISQNYKITREIAQNAKSCSKYKKLPKTCRATCGKPYSGRPRRTNWCSRYSAIFKLLIFFAEISFVERYSYNDKHLSRLPFKRLLSIKRTRLDQGGCRPLKLKATPGQCGFFFGNLRLIVNIFSSSHFHTADAWATPRAELQGTTSYFPVQL